MHAAWLQGISGQRRSYGYLRGIPWTASTSCSLGPDVSSPQSHALVLPLTRLGESGHGFLSMSSSAPSQKHPLVPVTNIDNCIFQGLLVLWLVTFRICENMLTDGSLLIYYPIFIFWSKNNCFCAARLSELRWAGKAHAQQTRGWGLQNAHKHSDLEDVSYMSSVTRSPSGNLTGTRIE